MVATVLAAVLGGVLVWVAFATHGGRIPALHRVASFAERLSGLPRWSALPVVIGFPSRIANDTAYKFAATFHQNLLHIPVELAVSQARRSLCVQRSTDLDWSYPLLFSRRNDSGPILRLIPPEPTAESRKADQRRPGVISFNTRSTRADEVINAGYVGDTPPPELPQIDVSFTQDSVEARSVKNFGFLVINGFSSEDLGTRDRQMTDLLKAIDEGRATEARHE